MLFMFALALQMDDGSELAHYQPGLSERQAWDEKRLDLAFNASFAAVNVIKVMSKEFKLDISLGQIKALMISAPADFLCDS